MTRFELQGIASGDFSVTVSAVRELADMMILAQDRNIALEAEVARLRADGVKYGDCLENEIEDAIDNISGGY